MNMTFLLSGWVSEVQGRLRELRESTRIDASAPPASPRGIQSTGLLSFVFRKIRGHSRNSRKEISLQSQSNATQRGRISQKTTVMTSLREAQPALRWRPKSKVRLRETVRRNDLG